MIMEKLKSQEPFSLNNQTTTLNNNAASKRKQRGELLNMWMPAAGISHEEAYSLALEYLYLLHKGELGLPNVPQLTQPFILAVEDKCVNRSCELLREVNNNLKQNLLKLLMEHGYVIGNEKIVFTNKHQLKYLDKLLDTCLVMTTNMSEKRFEHNLVGQLNNNKKQKIVLNITGHGAADSERMTTKDKRFGHEGKGCAKTSVTAIDICDRIYAMGLTNKNLSKIRLISCNSGSSKAIQGKALVEQFHSYLEDSKFKGAYGGVKLVGYDGVYAQPTATKGPAVKRYSDAQNKILLNSKKRSDRKFKMSVGTNSAGEYENSAGKNLGGVGTIPTETTSIKKKLKWVCEKTEEAKSEEQGSTKFFYPTMLKNSDKPTLKTHTYVDDSINFDNSEWNIN